jgi:hypothetical protein
MLSSLGGDKGGYPLKAVGYNVRFADCAIMFLKIRWAGRLMHGVKGPAALTKDAPVPI